LRRGLTLSASTTEKEKRAIFLPLRARRRKALSPKGSRAAPPHAQAREVPGEPGLAPAAAKGLSGQVFKKKIRMKRQQQMADANRPPPIAHDASDANTMMILTPDERAALTVLLVNGIMDTGSNRVAALYRGILTSLSQLSPCTIEITEEMALAGAKTLAARLRMDWDGLYPGRVNPKYPAWKVGAHANAHQDDYIDLSRAIIAAGLAARAQPYGAPPKLTRQQLDRTIDELRTLGGDHLLPIITAVRDAGGV